MALIDDADFQSWLEETPRVCPGLDPGEVGCTHCGVALSTYPFIGDLCLVCVAVMYGRFIKAQEIALWLEHNAWLWQPGDVNHKAFEIEDMGTEYRKPLAHETDQEAEDRWAAEDLQRAKREEELRSRSKPPRSSQT